MADTERKQHITLQLDAHHVSMNVPPDLEPTYRKAGELLNERYRLYLHKKPSASAEDLWVYTALELAVNLQANAYKHRLDPIREKLDELNMQIENILTKE